MKSTITKFKMKKIILVALISLSVVGKAQKEDKEDPKKIVREVITLEVERALHTVAPVTVVTPTVPPKKGKEVVAEAPIEGEAPPDTLSPLIPAPLSEVVKRAQYWYNSKSAKFTKSNGTNVGNNTQCNVSVKFKQKALNPENEVDGKITMEIIIEAKEGKYRYTIKNMAHQANKQGMSGGDIYLVVPECGSMLLGDRTWKLIKAEALMAAKLIADDLKATMKKEINTEKDEW
jgi:hypothetical protein